MKKWPWRRILTIAACSLVPIGLAPITYLLWFVYTTNWTPLSMPLPLNIGSYTSPSFKTGLHDKDKPYYLVVVADRILDGQGSSCLEGGKLIESHACRGEGRLLQMDWKIVDDQGTVFKQGSYAGQIYGGIAEDEKVGEYLPKPGTPLRVVLDVHQDIQGFDAARPRLELQANPEYGLENAYGSAAFLAWAVVIAGPGVIILLALLTVHLLRRWKSNSAPVS
jgi:hypothetical protein